MLREFLVFLAYFLVTQLQGHMFREFLVFLHTIWLPN